MREERRSRWKEHVGEEMSCARCGGTRDSTELDRMLWCQECVADARARADRVGWIAGGLLVVALALYIWLGVGPAPDLIPGGWLAVLVAAGWLGSKLVRETAYGIIRARE